MTDDWIDCELPKAKTKKATSRKDIIRRILNEIPEGKDKKNIELITRAVINKAIQGDVKAFNSLFDSAFGKIEETINAKHTIKRMDTVMIESSTGQMIPLEMNVGKPLPVLDGECSEVDNT